MADLSDLIRSGKRFDYIIVGGGTAGCVLANRLSEDPTKQVLLLEAGGPDNYHWIHIPIGYLYCIGNPRTDWLYKTREEPGLNGRSLIYPRGRVLGGCSSINGMIYMRGQTADYEQWAESSGDDRWRWENVLPYYKRSEDHHGGANEFHGAGGHWRVEKQRLSWELLDTFADAANGEGIPSTADFNRGNNFGVSYFEVNQRKGFRWNTSRGFLKPAKKRMNLSVLTGAQVDKLIIDTTQGNRCRGVLLDGGIELHAHREVILSSGAIGSVAILERSGIGQTERLRELGIPVVQHLPGVGENLQDHLQLRMVFKVSGVKTLNTMANNWWGKMLIGMEYVFRRSGPMSMAPSQLGVFAHSGPEHTWPNVQYHVQPLSLEKFGDPLHPFNAFTASVCNLRPSSRGHVHIQSKDMWQAPSIAPNYLSTDEDRKVAAQSLRLTRQIVYNDALKKYSPQEIKPGIWAQSEEDLVKAAGEIGTTIFHPVGTCKMGRYDDATAVVDSELRVIGVQGLRVADASVMPTITSGNTCSPTVMITERAADLILAQG